jgi:predicted enzyme related to lactoylglutathione lyase
MAVRESYAPGTPSWVDLSTTDVDDAKRFYAGLFGWDFEDLPAGDEGMYSMASLRGHRTAAIASQQPQQAAAGVPPHWMLYITVGDVDAAAAKVAGAGGTVHAGPFDVMDAGRMVVIQDPVGAHVCLWEPNTSIGAELVNEPGAFTWEELLAPGAKSAAPFYEAVVGLKYFDMPMPDGSTYGGFTLDGTADTMVGGAMEAPMPDIPPHWSIYFGAEDVDASTAKVKELGGIVHAEPFDIPVGRMAVVADPQGAVFNLFRMPAPES